MRSRVGALFCILALLQIIGGHWAILQTAAWIEMAVQYSQHGGIAAGLTRTFDGAHPCSMCRAIKAASNQEQNKAPMLRSEFKNDFVAEENRFQIEQIWMEVEYFWVEEQMQSIVLCPLVPPPRAV